MKRAKRIYNLLIVVALSLAFAGCKSGGDEGVLPGVTAPYGYYTLGEEEVAVASYTTAEGVQFLLKLSPLEDILSATTYAVVGVNTALMGERIDVERHYHNDDYLFVYEDPVCYYSHLKPLQSGTILLSRTASGKVSVEVDVRLYDGTPFRYVAEGLNVSEKQ